MGNRACRKDVNVQRSTNLAAGWSCGGYHIRFFPWRCSSICISVDYSLDQRRMKMCGKVLKVMGTKACTGCRDYFFFPMCGILLQLSSQRRESRLVIRRDGRSVFPSPPANSPTICSPRRSPPSSTTLSTTTTTIPTTSIAPAPTVPATFTAISSSSRSAGAWGTRELPVDFDEYLLLLRRFGLARRSLLHHPTDQL